MSILKIHRLAILSLALLAPGLSWAWGAEGHRLTGLIAQAMLEPKVRLEVLRLVPGGLADAANYMDVQRPMLGQKYPGSAQWHYDDVPVCEASTQEDYCPNGACASAKIRQYMEVLGDFHSTRDQKAEALRFIVHMVGDIHQPLHAATNAGDRGGNLVKIMYKARNAKLHAAWDTEFVKIGLRGQSEEKYARNLLSRFDAEVTNWQKGTPGRWVAESHEIAKKVTYGKLPGFACQVEMTNDVIEIDDTYREEAAGIVASRITAAGVRLAWLLNRVMGQ